MTAFLQTQPKNRSNSAALLPVLLRVLLVAAPMVLAYCYQANAQTVDESSQPAGDVSPSVPSPFPDFLGPRTDVSAPDVRGVTRFRFLTTTDFPPFNYINRDGRLSGFHIDLARGICDVLSLGARCQIEAMPFEELEDALLQGRGEAVIAGQVAGRFGGADASASPAYFRFAGRFLQRRDAAISAEDPLDLPPQTRVVAIEGSAHAAYLAAFFPDLTVVPVTDRQTLHLALTSAIAEYAFDDATATANWLASAGIANCCRFTGAPYFSDRYFGAGLTVATRADDRTAAQIVRFALYEMRRQGVFQELYLRHFPVAPF